MLVKIISGGQTGVDRAALDVSINLGIDHSGWCPRGRLAEDGVIDDKYNLKQTDSELYEERTAMNIRDSDGTLVVIPRKSFVKAISDGTKLTVELLETNSKPYLIVEVFDSDSIELNSRKVIDWLNENNIKQLNIAGPRESTYPGIYDKTFEFLTYILTEFQK